MNDERADHPKTDTSAAANPATEHATAGQIEVTWASTSADPAKRERLGKIWKPEGEKWPVTDGVKRLAYVFEQPKYPDLEAFGDDLDARVRTGAYALVAGRLKRLPETLDRDRAYRRVAKNFADLKCWLLTLDVDGLAPTKAGERLDRPEDFGKRALAEFRKRLPAALAAADCLLVATSSTGLPFNAKGEPANGCARFRAIFMLSRPLFFAEQKELTLALKQLPGLECLGEEICTLPQFCFIARPEFLDGMADPIPAPVLLFKGEQPQVDVDALERQIDITITITPRRHTRPSRGGRLLDVDPGIRHGLIERLVATIPNDTVEHGGDWIAVMHGIKGASGDPDWGKPLWLEFCARWTKGNAKQDEDERAWDTARFDHGHSGIHALLKLAWRAGTREAIAAVEAVKLAQAQWAFRDPPDDLPDDDPDPPPRIVCPTIFTGRVPPPRRWIVPQWIPYEVVTGFYGDGGVGKSLLVQQLQTATALGATWIGLPVEQTASLGVYCEDDENELWRRQCPINASYFADHDTLGLTHWMSRLGEDNLLMTFGRSGVGKLTKFHAQVLEAAIDLKVKLVIVDTAADVFGGNENDRGQVRQFVQRALGGIALKIGGAVVCCAHPSRAGLKSGDGDSGSTGWSNAFRSRLYLSHVEDHPNGRILERKKANYAARNDELKLRWHHGVIIPDGIAPPDAPTMAKVAEIKATFLDLLREMNRQKRPVSSSSKSSNYAPREFERLPTEQRRGFGQVDFEKAMNALFLSGAIENVDYGRKGDERTRIVVREVTEQAETDEP
jgi:RecA-family ATPase